MSIRGPKPAPPALKLITGNPGRREIPRPLHVDSELPEPPDYLDEIARAEWLRVADELGGLGLLTALDVAVCVAYCTSFSTWQQAQTLLRTSSMLQTGAHGNQVKNPLVAIARDARLDMVRFAAEFGMTPSARSRVHPTGAPRGKGNRFNNNGRRPTE